MSIKVPEGNKGIKCQFAGSLGCTWMHPPPQKQYLWRPGPWREGRRLFKTTTYAHSAWGMVQNSIAWNRAQIGNQHVHWPSIPGSMPSGCTSWWPRAQLLWIQPIAWIHKRQTRGMLLGFNVMGWLMLLDASWYPVQTWKKIMRERCWLSTQWSQETRGCPNALWIRRISKRRESGSNEKEQGRFKPQLTLIHAAV